MLLWYKATDKNLVHCTLWALNKHLFPNCLPESVFKNIGNKLNCLKNSSWRNLIGIPPGFIKYLTDVRRSGHLVTYSKLVILQSFANICACRGRDWTQVTLIPKHQRPAWRSEKGNIKREVVIVVIWITKGWKDKTMKCWGHNEFGIDESIPSY
jgi:hypothetical protein